MRPTKDEWGRPLGYRKGTYWIWLPTLPRRKDGSLRAFRHETKSIDGERGTLIPYTYKKGTRRAEGPRGGKAKQEFYFRLYNVVRDGENVVCRFRHELLDVTDDGLSYHDWWEPFTGMVWNYYEEEGMSYQLVDGHVVKVNERKSA